MLNSSSDKRVRRLAQNVILTDHVCPALKKVIGRKEFLIEEIDGLYNALKCDCSGFLVGDDFHSLSVTRDNIFPSTHAWAFRKGTPFLDYMNRYIYWFHESGLQQKWSEELTSIPRDFRFAGLSKKGGTSATNKNPFSGQFVLLFIGTMISGLCFIAEIVVHNIVLFRRKRYTLKRNLFIG